MSDWDFADWAVAIISWLACIGIVALVLGLFYAAWRLFLI